MSRSVRTFGALVVCLTVTLLALGPAQAQEAADKRGEQILANLKLAFPQLENQRVVMGSIEPSEFGGLDRGTLSVDGAQIQNFFVSEDNTKLFFIGEKPIDVSRTADEIAVEVAKQTVVAANQTAARHVELTAAVDGLPFRGGAKAPVTIVEFSDFQCPYCSRGAVTVQEILDKYGDDVRFVFKNFPLDFHPWARPAAIAAHCVAAQSAEAFWTLHDAYYTNQKELSAENLIDKTKEYLASSGIKMKSWSACAEDTGSEAYKAAAAAVDADIALGQKHGVNGTPGFFVNGTLVSGAQPLSAFEPLIDAAVAQSR